MLNQINTKIVKEIARAVRESKHCKCNISL